MLKELYEKCCSNPSVSGACTCVYFIRHAQPDISVREDLIRPLTEKGQWDAVQAAAVLKDKNITAVYSSPFKRSIDTVRPLADLLGVEIVLEDNFRERKIDDGWIEDFNAFSRMQWEDFGYKLENGECLREVQERNVRALNAVLADHPGGNVAVGTHGTALSTILRYFCPDFGYDDFLELKSKMPYILCFQFVQGKCIGIREYDIQLSH